MSKTTIPAVDGYGAPQFDTTPPPPVSRNRKPSPFDSLMPDLFEGKDDGVIARVPLNGNDPQDAKRDARRACVPYREDATLRLQVDGDDLVMWFVDKVRRPRKHKSDE